MGGALSVTTDQATQYIRDTYARDHELQEGEFFAEMVWPFATNAERYTMIHQQIAAGRAAYVRKIGQRKVYRAIIPDDTVRGGGGEGPNTE